MHPRHAAAAILLLLLAFSDGSDDALHVRAIQHGGWWEVRYPDGTTSANVMHVPVGRGVTVDIALDGFGVVRFDRRFLPRVGRGARVTFVPSRGEVITMRELSIIADDHFDAWLAHERSPAVPPHDRGEAVFLTARCTLCHSVRGVAMAEHPIAPDLTHFASRTKFSDGYLAGWVVDAETLEPGAGMPVNNIDSRDLQPLLAFLRSLE
jgi:hypothetical protein